VEPLKMSCTWTRKREILNQGREKKPLEMQGGIEKGGERTKTSKVRGVGAE